MENRNEIVNELRTLSPTLASFGPLTPYQVPTGYFEGLAERILQRVTAMDAGISLVLPEVKSNVYEVPQGYFEGLAAQVLQRVKAGNEAMAPFFETVKGINPYQVPQGYFDTLAEAVLKRVKAENADSAKEELEILSPLLNKISKKAPFSTPDGYFGELTDNVVAGAKAIDFVNEELENLSPVMISLKSKTVYEVPAGYFENLPAQLLSKAKTAKPAKVVSMTFARKVMRVAAAAVVTGIIIAAGWLYIGNNKPVTNNGDPAVAGIENISDSSLLSYIENQNIPLPETTTGNDEIGEGDMKDLLADVSDDELQQYIDKYSTNKNIQTN
jgi:hypothetical protein